MSLRLKLALQGDLRKMVAEEIARAERAVTAGVRATADGLKSDLRAEAASALGPRIARAWRSENYPRAGASAGAASIVWTKAPHIIRAFEEGATIRSRNGFWLAIPTLAAPKTGTGGKRISPSNFPEHSFGKLRFVYRGAGRPGLLVVDNLRASTGKRGGFRKASDSALKSGRGLTTVPMFILVPQVTLPRRLDVAARIRAWEGRLVPAIEREWLAQDRGS